VSHRPLEDWEYPDPDDDEEGDDEETSPCPACGEEIYEDAERCPYCGEYVLLGGGSPLAGRPWWYVLLAALGVIATLATILSWRS
jgi:hypothetical protein